ncbi:hypothetical protein CsSME_00051937 [Camellia sinensis var. sinensis]
MRWEEGKLHFRKQGLWAAHREQDCRISLGTRTTTQQNVVDCPQGNSASCQDSNICYLITTTCFATELSTHQNKVSLKGRLYAVGLEHIGQMGVEATMGQPNMSYVVTLLSMGGLIQLTSLKEQTCNWQNYCGVGVLWSQGHTI